MVPRTTTSRTARRRSAGSRQRSRLGTATVELAVCLPMLALLVFGSIQACDMIYLKRNLISAAYEATLEASKAGATNAKVTARAQQLLDAHGISDSTISIQPAGTVVEQLPPGSQLTISISAQASPNLTISKFFFTPSSLTGEVTSTR